MSMNVLSDEVQLGFALVAFAAAHQMEDGWAMATLLSLNSAGIASMGDLSTGCKDNTVNLDMELFGTPPDQRPSVTTIRYLKSFLPGPVGIRCFRLAQRIAQKVAKGSADTEYVHRPENGKKGDEEWHVPVDDQWVVNVDCAGFVRNALKHVTKNPFVMALSDRDFMRAKDFYDFFSTIPFTVVDLQDNRASARLMKWRIVNDLRMVIPGDVIVYRPKGNAAGGAAFTTTDRKDLNHMLKAVKAAQVWQDLRSSGALVTKNVAKDPEVKNWVTAVKNKLNAIEIRTMKDLYNNIGSINEKLEASDLAPLHTDTLQLMKECCETTAMNTGHIVFASGSAVRKGDNIYRIRVVHSTKYGKKDENGQVTTGVQEYYRKFTLKEDSNGEPFWTRAVAVAENLITCGTDDDEEGENPNDDMEEEDDDDLTNLNDPDQGEQDDSKPIEDDELAGQSEVEVIAARMCF